MSGPKIREFSPHARQRLAERFPAFVRDCGGIDEAQARVILGLRRTGKAGRGNWWSVKWKATATVPQGQGPSIEFYAPIRQRSVLTVFDTSTLPR